MQYERETLSSALSTEANTTEQENEGFGVQRDAHAGSTDADRVQDRTTQTDESVRTDASVIPVVPGQLHTIVEDAERALAARGRHYQRAGCIVAIRPGERGELPKSVPLSAPALQTALSRAAQWMREDGRTHEWRPIDPPMRHTAALHQADAYSHLPVLTGIVGQPYLREDGTLALAPGYDSQTGLYGAFEPSAFHVPEHPTRAEAEQALEQLEALLGEFTFASPVDRSAALAGILTAAVRASLPAAPMFHVRAPQIASGKSYLTTLIALFVGSRPPSPSTFPVSEEECQKLLLARLIESPPVIVFDNLTDDLLPHPTLCSALTEEQITGRILGLSRTATVGTRCMMLSSGNNVGPVRDMARRCVTVILKPSVETPAARQYRGDPVQTVRKHRARYVSLALTIVRAWICAGHPEQKCPRLATFDHWSSCVRQPLLWLGREDPAARVFEQLASDPDRESLGRLLHAWRGEFGDTPTRVRQAVQRAGTGPFVSGNPELREALQEVAEERGEINRRRLGRWLARHQDRIVDGLCFVRAAGSTNAERWIAKSVSSDMSVSTGTSGRVSDEVVELTV